MSYTVNSTEKTTKSGAEGETKALLYLMNLRSDSNEIYYFVVDFFNDLTGMDRYASDLWDVQAKANTENTPREVGKALVTLFKNFLSDISFKYYILFLGGVTSSLRVDDTLTSFDVSNIVPDSLELLIKALKKEAEAKTYINNADITDENISNFLKNVLFVIEDRKPSEYVKAILKDHPKIIPEEQKLIAIFDEIRDKQSAKKNINKVEGVTIETANEALHFCRHLTTNEIKLFVLQRILNRNPVDKGIPSSFIPIYNLFPAERQQELREQCQQTLCRALFNKNAAESFWTLFENIYFSIINNPDYDVQAIFNILDKSIMESNPDFETLSLKYFISIIKDGLQDDN